MLKEQKMSIRCWKCGAVMPQNAIFCNKCGSNLSKEICEFCGRQIPLKSKFCIFCGREIGSIEEKRITESLPKETNVFQKKAVKQTKQEFSKQNNEGYVQTSTESIIEKEDGLSKEKPSADYVEESKRNFSWNNRKGTTKVTYSFSKVDVNFKEENMQIIKTKGKNEVKTDIPYNNICGTELFTNISPLYMPLVIIILMLLVYMIVSNAAGIGGTLAIFAVFVFMCWNFSFQICHFDLVITEKNGKHTVISAKKQKILLEIMDMIQTQAELLSKENIKKASVLTKNEVYYGNQFRFCEHGLKCNFHWFAFFFGPFFCFYRSGGKLFREFFQTFFVLLVVTTLGFSFSLKSFANALNDGFALWMNVCWIWFGILSIYGIYCAIRCGREFNQYYFRYCNMLAGREKSKNGCEASWKKAIFAVILYGILMGVLVTGISKGMSSAILADAYQQAANDTNTEIPTDVKHEEQEFQKSLQPYLGTWYVSNADGSAAFSSAEYAQNEEFAIYGLKLEIVPIKGSYYARLTSNIHPFDYGFTERTLNGDSLLPITQTGDASWSISFDEIDESNASNVVRGTSKLILTINTVGDLYGEITDSEIPENNMAPTKLYPSYEWLDGQYQYYNEEESICEEWIDEEHAISVFECEELLNRGLYGSWYDDSNVAASRIDFAAGDIYVYSMRGSFYKDYSYYLKFAYKDQPDVIRNIRLTADSSGDMYLDEKHYWK